MRGREISYSMRLNYLLCYRFAGGKNICMFAEVTFWTVVNYYGREQTERRVNNSNGAVKVICGHPDGVGRRAVGVL